MNFQERKKLRVEHFEKFVKGWKEVPCIACNGSGYYDNNINGKIPKCGSCKGTGKEKISPEQFKNKNNE